MAYDVVDLVVRNDHSKYGAKTPPLADQLNGLPGRVISVMHLASSSHSGFIELAAYRVVIEVSNAKDDNPNRPARKWKEHLASKILGRKPR